MSEAAQKPKKAKSVVLAVILNATPLLIFGIGYLYIGKWVRFIIVEVLQLLSLIAFFAWRLQTQNFLALVWLASMIDVLIQALNYNQQIAKSVNQQVGLLS